jgi:hypothetical protein
VWHKANQVILSNQGKKKEKAKRKVALLWELR